MAVNPVVVMVRIGDGIDDNKRMFQSHERVLIMLEQMLSLRATSWSVILKKCARANASETRGVFMGGHRVSVGQRLILRECTIEDECLNAERKKPGLIFLNPLLTDSLCI